MAIELLYDRGTLAVDPAAGLRADRHPQACHAGAARPGGRDRAGAGAAGRTSPPLRELARGSRSACILICDITRPVPNGLFLPPLIRTLIEAGMPREGITVLVATGLHRPNEGEELAELVGDPWVLETVRVVNHFATQDEDHVLLGRTPRAARWSGSTGAWSRPS